jgi:tetratricopeptide (TPR) repeat protein
MHRRVGEAIERLYGPDPASHLGELAYHFSQVAATGEGAKAGEYARKAGDRAMESHAYEDAVAQYRRALDVVVSAGPAEALRCELLLCLGSAHARAGDYQEGKRSFLRAAEIARRLEIPEQVARAALGYGEPQVEGGLVDHQLLALLQEALDALSPEDSAVRSRLLARFSMELTFSDEPALRDTLREDLSREALEMARRLDAPAAIALACRARWMAVWGPDGLDERSGLSEEILRLAWETGDRALELVGRARRITCSTQSGDIGAAKTDIAAHARLAGELHMPYHEWTAMTLRAERALLDGSFGAAEEFSEGALSLLPGRPGASQAHFNQATLIRWEQGRLGELREAWQGLVEQFPQAAFGRGWLSLADAELGNEEDARRALRSLVEELSELPRNGLWLPALATVSLAAAHLHEPDAAASVYPLLLPYARRTIVIPMPHPVVCFGSASFYLGLLAAALSRWEEGGEHFESAIQANTRLRARPFVARSQYEYARMLVRRGQAAARGRVRELLDRAESTARALGMAAVGAEIERLRELEAGAAVAAQQGEATVIPKGGGKNVFRREGDYWTVVYEGSLVRLRDSKGLRHLARLLADPGREFHASDLEVAQDPGRKPAPSTAGKRGVTAELEARPDLGDAGELLDAKAKAAYKSRLEELRAELDEAESFNDPGRAAKAKEEMDFLAKELSRAVGLGGRERRAASHAERARLNATRAIRAAIRNLSRVNPALGRHLSSTIRTGRYCSYTPDARAEITWEA